MYLVPFVIKHYSSTSVLISGQTDQNPCCLKFLHSGDDRNPNYWVWVAEWVSTVTVMFSLVQFSCSVVSDSLWPHELQHAMLPCPSPTPRTCSNSCTSSQWCHSAISSSVIFSPQSFPASSGSFLMCQLFASGGQSIGAFASVLLMNIQDWSPLGLAGLISL